jgi:hypothetical protein
MARYLLDGTSPEESAVMPTATPSEHHRRILPAVLIALAALTITCVPHLARAHERGNDVREHAVSECGRHKLEVTSGAVLVDGRRVNPSARVVEVLTSPTCRSDGRAVAWIERRDGELRLVVLPEMERQTDALPWPLPFVASNDQVFWATSTRVVVGPSLLAPRAVASWSESLR